VHVDVGLYRLGQICEYTNVGLRVGVRDRSVQLIAILA